MIIKRFILIFLMFAAFGSFAQHVTWRVGSGIGTYNMKDMKENMEFSKIFIPVDVHSFNNFPPYFNFHLALRPKQISELVYVEAECGYYSTGSRLEYKDYSGEYVFDMVVSAYSLSFKSGSYFHNRSKFKMALYEEIASYFTTIHLNENIRVYDESSSGKSSVNAISIGLEAGVTAELFINEHFSGFTSLGYYKQVNTFKRMASKPDWSGIRFEFGLLVNF